MHSEQAGSATVDVDNLPAEQLASTRSQQNVDLIPHAPARDGEIAAAPALQHWPSLAADNRRSVLSLAETRILGEEPLRESRQRARSELAVACNAHLQRFHLTSQPWDESAPLIAVGHQPEAFHAGVWAKNFAVARLAERIGGVGCHVIADHDAVKSAGVWLPAGTRTAPMTAALAFDHNPGDVPYECWEIGAADTFANFGQRVVAIIAGHAKQAVMTRFWPAVLQASLHSNNVGLCLAAGRRAIEQHWHAWNLETPLSTIAAGTTFRRFVASLTLNCEAFALAHNRELSLYRKAHRVRDHLRPFPQLAVQSDAVEAPFWIWSTSEPRRRPLFVKRTATRLQFLAGAVMVAEFDASLDETRLAERLGAELGNWRIRPRALTTTLFLRLFVADLFVHGIGGGKYDGLTDAIARTYFGVELPRFAVLSATCLVDPNLRFDAAAALSRARQLERDIVWNPDRHLDAVLREQSPLADWIESKHELMATDKHGDRERFRRFRELNDKLRPYAAIARQAAAAATSQAELNLANERILADREYPFFVHDVAAIDRLIDRLVF